MVELSQSLALVAARLNEDARAALLALLSGELQDQVADQVRRVDPESESLEDYQRQLLAGFTPPVRAEASEQEEQYLRYGASSGYSLGVGIKVARHPAEGRERERGVAAAWESSQQVALQ